MESTKIAYIYILIDPRDNEVRYVGKTCNPTYRLSGHISECKKKYISHYRARWIRSLLKDDLIPIIKFIKVCSLIEFEKFESEYIKKFKSEKLTNSDESGQGNSKRIKEVIDRQSENSGKIVYQYSLNGIFIKDYRSVREAARELNTSHASISRCCNGEYKQANGFIFRYKKIKVDKVKATNIKKAVIEVNENCEEIGKWDSIMDCSRDTRIDNGSISRVCNKHIKSIKNRFFMFKE